MGPVDRAARVHGHLVGLRLVPRYHVRRHQSARTTRRRRHGPFQVPRRHRVRRPLLYRLSTSNFLFIFYLFKFGNIFSFSMCP